MKTSALSYHVSKSKNQKTAEEAETALCQTRNQVFPAKLEEELKEYILMSADSHVELDPQNIIRIY